MMELSIETPDDILDTFRKQKLDTSYPPLVSLEDTDIIDASKLSFSDDENWLYDTPEPSDTDLQSWLYAAQHPAAEAKSCKNIDTRTFTRPKKRFARPSIEKYNEELYGNDVRELTDSGIHLNGNSQDESPVKPLHFDLEQNASSVYFENILANAPMLDSFQNMSPPSLVNSMCSSTFANLMESSFIKNDPVLREIRDTDFTVSILQQEAEPMFQSISESYSSLNSDVPENFLKKVSYTEVGDTTIMNATFAKEEEEDLFCDQTVTVDEHFDDAFHDAKATIFEDLNNTYPRKSRITRTPLGQTFQRRKSDRKSLGNHDLNSTVTIEPDRIEPVKRLLDRRPSPSMDLNRLSYLVDKNDQMNSTFTAAESPKRNSFGSTDSGENLDYMSLSSSSSKSSRMQSNEGINAVVEQERKIFTRRSNQVSSTPKPRTKTLTLFPNHEISPIRDRNSDPELSSNEQQQAVIMQNAIRKQKSVGHINRLKMPNPKITFDSKTGIRGSHPNLKMSEPRSLPQRGSNLNSMGHALKGSYTSLRPTNTNLPVAPPPLDTTVTMCKNPAVAQVPPVPREVPSKSQDAQFVKPQPPRSGLPRPSTGIPRPVSRIPGPRTIRPVTKSAGYQGRY